MKDWKNDLFQAFDIPRPVQKETFIRQLKTPRIPIHQFLLSQICYIHKWIWFISAVVFLAAVLGLTILPEAVLWIISGLTPILALTILSESGRSKRYEMAELEMATRFSLRSVTFARLGILGISNLLLLALLLPIGIQSQLNPLAAGLYIITPFLLTTFIGLFLVRKMKGQESLYACIGTAIGVSFSVFFSHETISFIYQESWISLWMITAVALCIGTGRQFIKIITQTEETVWNLS